ncbi:hypothetical protein P3T37_003842 [Kitasatospora sp. MAA4]|uniref:hypothetical protein n=1 Tax=Kitasatospora sp. MAA4 TaxID=3035093 RepID=UPI0024765088|nr:hypothetical protein [Kitasatospora sp. MAA4]MDH6134439.1 hypothetical protein [Kitasatospora sp. MAA4]
MLLRVVFALAGTAVMGLGLLLAWDYRGISTRMKAQADASRQRGGLRGMFGPDSGDPRQVGWGVVLGGLVFVIAAVFGQRS